MDDNQVRKAIEAASIAMRFDTFPDFVDFAKMNGWSDEEIQTQKDAFPGASTTITEPPEDTGTEPLIPAQGEGLFAEYLDHLRGLNWAESTLSSIQESVEETYERLSFKNDIIASEDRPGYGLVVGRIQSGKTAHMLGVSFRALDSSLSHQGRAYDTVIILSGLLKI